MSAPNLFLTGLVTLITFTNRTHALPQGSGGRTAPGPATDRPPRHNNHPLSKDQIAGLVCGILLGVTTIVCVALALTNLEGVAGKMDSKKSKKTETTAEKKDVDSDSICESVTTVADAEHKELKQELNTSKAFDSDAASAVTEVPPEAHLRSLFGSLGDDF